MSSGDRAHGAARNRLNPLDIDAVAEAIAAALAMPPEERQVRHVALLERLRKESAKACCDAFTASLRGVNP